MSMSAFGDKLRTVNPEQVASVLRTIGQAGAAVTGYAWLGSDPIISALAGVVFTGLTWWGQNVRSDANLIKSVADMPAVKTVVTESVSAANSVPRPNVVPPGAVVN
jgi:Flp pilus assembly protein TadB